MDILDEVKDALEVPEIAQRLGLSHKTILNMIYRGDLRAWRIGNKWKVSPSDLRAFLEQCRPAETQNASVR